MEQEDDILTQLGIDVPTDGPQPAQDILDELNIASPNEPYLAKSPTLDALMGVPETALAMGTALPAMGASGLYGLAKGAVTGDPREIALGSMEGMSNLMYQPASATARNNLRLFQQFLTPYEEAKTAASGLISGEAERFTDNPFVLGTLDQSFNIVEMMLGGAAWQAGLNKVKTRVENSGKALNPDEIRQIMLEEGHPHESLYDVQLTKPGEKVKYIDDNGDVATKVATAVEMVPDLDGVSLVTDYRLPEAAVSFLKTAGPEELEYMRQMLDVYRGTKEAQYGSGTARYIDIIGERLADRISFLDNVYKVNGSRLNKLIETKMGNKVMNVNNIMNQWLTQLIKEMNIKHVKYNDQGKITIDYNGSLLEGNNASQSAINRVVSRLNEGTFTARDLHFLKKYIDENIDWSKPGRAGDQGGVSQSTENMFKVLRGQVNEALRKEIPQYGRVNDTMSQIIETLVPFNQALTKEFNLLDPGGIKQLGLGMRRISSNAKSGVTMREGLESLLELTDRLSKGSFRDNPAELQKFANIVERRFGSDAENSIGGIFGKESERVAARVAEAGADALTGNAMAAALKGVKNLMTTGEKSDAQALTALRSYLIELQKKAKKPQ